MEMTKECEKNGKDGKKVRENGRYENTVRGEEEVRKGGRKTTKTNIPNCTPDGCSRLWKSCYIVETNMLNPCREEN